MLELAIFGDMTENGRRSHGNDQQFPSVQVVCIGAHDDQVVSGLFRFRHDQFDAIVLVRIDVDDIRFGNDACQGIEYFIVDAGNDAGKDRLVDLIFPEIGLEDERQDRAAIVLDRVVDTDKRDLPVVFEQT